MRKGAFLLGIILTAACMVCGCGQQNSNKNAGLDTLTEVTGEGNVTGNATGNGALASLDTDEMFSDRDKEIGYDDSDCVHITLAGDTATASGNGVEIEGNTVKIVEEGTYVLTGTLNNGSIIIEVPDKDKVQLVLDGAEIHSDNYAAIYVVEADKVFLTTEAGSVNVLSNLGEFVQRDDSSVDGVIFSKADLTLNGAGALQISTAYGHGVVSKDDLVVTSGDYKIVAGGHGLAGKDSVRIANGSFDINADEDAVHASNSEDSGKGFVYIAGGTMEITAGDDALHAETSLLVEGGNINITECYEGMEAVKIDMLGGSIKIVAGDDGLNAAGGNDQSGNERGWAMMDTNADAYINIAGGTLHVDARGDGIDSNGYLYVSGGETYIAGPTNSGNGALDYALDAQISGGVLVATGMNGMAMNFGENSSQGTIMNNYASILAAGSVIELKSAAGEILVQYTAEKEYNSVVVSCPGINVGESYTLTAGEESAIIEMSSIVYGAGHGMGAFGGGRGGKGEMGGFGNFDGGKGGRDKGNNGQMPEMPRGDVSGGEIPAMPEGGFPGGEIPQMPEGGFPGGEIPAMPEGGFPGGEMPQMPEGGFPGGEMPAMPGGQMPESQTPNT